MMAGGVGFEPTTTSLGGLQGRLKGQKTANLEAFREFCITDLQLSESTTELHSRNLKDYLEFIKKEPTAVDQNTIRAYLKHIKLKWSSWTYKNRLSSLKRFYRDFLGNKHIIETFRFPEQAFEPKSIPSKRDLQKFYKKLECTRDRALFLIFASSGLRHAEILSLDRFKDIDFENRMLMPKKAGNQSKHCWVSFYNLEAERELRKYLDSRIDKGSKLFRISKRTLLKRFKQASRESGVRITPQILRQWFASEMGALGVQDRFLDAFCGRVPKSVLARHYTDFSPDRLKKIYERANLRVLA
jgi:integrase